MITVTHVDGSERCFRGFVDAAEHIHGLPKIRSIRADVVVELREVFAALEQLEVRDVRRTIIEDIDDDDFVDINRDDFEAALRALRDQFKDRPSILYNDFREFLSRHIVGS